MKLTVLLLILFTLSLTAYPQTPVDDAAVTEFDVKGLKVIFKRRASSPTITVGLFVRGGVRNQTPQNAGIEYLTLAAAAEASKKYPRESLRKELARTGTVISTGASFDYSRMLMMTTKENFARSWDAFTDVIFNPTFTAEDVDRVRNAVLAGLREESSSPDGALDTLEDKIIYSGHPYANSPNGTIETVSKLTPADLRAYHQKLLQASRLLLVIVGDADPADIRKHVTASFAGLGRGEFKDAPPPPLTFSQSSLDIAPRTLNTNYVKGIFASPSLTNPDYYAMRVAMAILQGRVFEEVRVRRNLSYAPNAKMGDRAANSASIYVTAVDANQAVRVMLDEIETMRKSEIDEDEFAGIPNYFLTTYYSDQETNEAQVSELAMYELIGGGWRNSMKFLDRIRNVKPEEVKAVSEIYMKNIRFVVVGNPSAIDQKVFLRN
jgi:predicted Zn-dependent peptidase